MAKGRRQQLISAAGLITVVTAFSRMLGLVRDALIAAVLGDSKFNDIFQMAFAIPNMARRVLGEGSLSAYIVPIITGVRRERGEQAAWVTMSNSLNLFAAITLAMTIVGCIFSDQLFLLYGGAYFKLTGQNDLLQLGGSLTRIMFPFLMFLALIALLMGVCHSLKHFLMPALGSVMINITMIGGTLLFFRAEPMKFVYMLAWAVLLGGILRLLILLPPLLRRGFRWRPVLNWHEPGFRELASKMPAAVYATAIAQINIAISLTLARWTGEGSVTYLMYSQRIVQLPQALIAMALSTALLPQLSHVVQEGDRQSLRRLMSLSFRIIALIFVPASIGLIVLARPIVEVILERGGWDATATANTARALIYYSIGLYALGIYRVLVPVYYAQKDMMTPVKMGAITMVCNAAMSLIFMQFLSYAGLALASSLAATLNAYLLWRRVRTRLGADLAVRIWATLFKALGASAVMGMVVGFGFYLTEKALAPAGTLPLLGLIMLWIAVGMGVYALSARLVGLWDRESIRRVMGR